MHAHYIATLQEDLNKYENALNLAATLVQHLQSEHCGEEDNVKDYEEFINLKAALLELGYEIK